MIIEEQDYLRHDAFLKHYGVSGMKWGVRKANKSGTSPAYIAKLKKKYGNAIRLNKKTGKYEINKNSNEYKTAKKIVHIEKVLY